MMARGALFASWRGFDIQVGRHFRGANRSAVRWRRRREALFKANAGAANLEVWRPAAWRTREVDIDNRRQPAPLDFSTQRLERCLERLAATGKALHALHRPVLLRGWIDRDRAELVLQWILQLAPREIAFRDRALCNRGTSLRCRAVCCNRAHKKRACLHQANRGHDLQPNKWRRAR